jgi:radical SAM protein with 4Fe4S-binding SPASM domain
MTKHAPRPPCAGLWATPMIHVDGSVTTCCLDEHLENKVGNVIEQSLERIWHGETMNEWRIAHLAGRFEDSGPLCTRCNWQSAGAAPEAVTADWLARFHTKTG